MQLIEPKVTRAQEPVAAAAELFDVVEKRQELEKREKALKKYFSTMMPKGGALQAGTHIVTVVLDTRRSLVRDLVVKLLGEAQTKKCERKTPYHKVSVKSSGADQGVTTVH